MRRPLLYGLGLVMIVCACSSKPSTNYKDLKGINLQTIGVNMALPSLYREYSIADEMEALEDTNYPDQVKAMRHRYLTNLLLQPQPTQFIADSLHKENNIRIIESSIAVKVGKYTSKEAFLAMDRQMQQLGELLSINYEAIENTYFSLANGNDIMKMRYRARELKMERAGFLSSDDEHIGYTTFYVVVNKKKTLFVVVNHDSEDFEYFIRTIEFQ